jgi:hypothetical protein
VYFKIEYVDHLPDDPHFSSIILQTVLYLDSPLPFALTTTIRLHMGDEALDSFLSPGTLYATRGELGMASLGSFPVLYTVGN